jgi:hypothetical protein
MRRILTIIISVLVFTSLNSNAQNQSNFEKLNAYKIAFFTKKINLTSPEAEKFWPIYNEYQDKKNQIQQEKIALMRSFNQSGTSMNETQLIELGDKIVATVVKESDLTVELHKKLKTVLPPEKVIRVYQAENQYKAQLLKELQNARQN